MRVLGAVLSWVGRVLLQGCGVTGQLEEAGGNTGRMGPAGSAAVQGARRETRDAWVRQGFRRMRKAPSKAEFGEGPVQFIPAV